MSKRFVRTVAVLVALALFYYPVQRLNAEVSVDNRPPEATSAAVAVDTQSGRASQAIPIEIPPGVKGIQPSVQLIYSSSRAMGILGVGWGLELGAIERSNRFGVPKYDTTDLYELAIGGSRQLLVLDSTAGFYRAEIEGAFLKTVYDSGTKVWTVTDKSGTKYTFGSTDASRQTDPGNSSRIFRWALNRVEDLNGNFYTITYTKDNGQIYPAQIKYTGNTTTNLTPFAQIDFVLDATRAKNHFSYLPGFKVTTTKRIGSIRVSTDKGLQREYKLGYTASLGTGRDLLTSVSRYGTDGSKLPDTLLKYYDNSKGFVQDTSASIPSAVQFSSANSGYQPYRDLGVRVADINNDGFPDIIRDYTSVNSANQVSGQIRGVYLNNKSNGWVLDNAYRFPGDCTNSQQPCITFIKEVVTGSSAGTVYPDYSLYIADVDANGKNELIHSRVFTEFTMSGQINNQTTNWDERRYEFDTQNGWVERGFNMPSESRFMIWITNNNNGAFSYRIEMMGNQMADVDSDGDLDIVISRKIKSSTDYNNAVENYKAVALNSPLSSSFTSGSTWTRPDNEFTDLSKGAVLVDLNGDGLPDIMYRKSGSSTKVFMNTGYNWVEEAGSPWENTQGFGDLKDGTTQMADINGDGLTDMIAANGSKVLINTGNGWVPDNAWTLPEANLVNLGTRLLDANADTMMDFINHYNGNTPKLFVNAGKPADLLMEIDSGVGGLTTLTYGTSSRFPQTFMPFAMPVITEMKVSNKQGTTFTTKYEYSEGLWVPRLAGSPTMPSEFRGFGKVTVWSHEGHRVENRYLQGQYTKGRLSEAKYFDSYNKLLRKDSFTWAEQSIVTGAKFVYKTQNDTSIYNANGDSASWTTKFLYNENPQYGNVKQVEETQNGRRWIINYTYNPDKWLLGLPRSVELQDFGGNPFRRNWTYYDNSTDNNAVPQTGNATRVEQWAGTSQPSDNPVSLYEYNALGLVTKITEPNQAVKPLAERKSTIVNYDLEYGIFPVTVTNPLGQTAKAEYYGVAPVPANDSNGLWGQIKSIEDANGQKTQSVYDVFGRPRKVIGPKDTLALPTSETQYDFIPAATPIITKITTKQRVNHGNSATLDSYQYIDGLGRLLQVKTPSADAGKYAVSGQAKYDSRGAALESYLPFFSTNSLDTIEAINTGRGHTTAAYDGLGRVTETINPDGTRSNVSYDRLAVNVIDENGHQHGAEFNTAGQLVKRIEYTGADGRFPSLYSATTPNFTPYATTLYAYNTAGELIKTTDNDGKATDIAYDTLGRKKSMQDGDMGFWEYSYDPNGNLRYQIDAKNSQTTFTYDELNRLLRKDFDNGQIDAVYTYDDANVSNSRGLLTAVQYGNPDRDDYRYDNLGRMVSLLQTTGASTYTTQQDYDALNRVTSLTYPDGVKVNYAYNPAGQLQKVTLDRTNEGNGPAPQAPAQMIMNAPVSSVGQVALSWPAMSGVDGYRVYQGTTAGNLAQIKEQTDTTATITGLTTGSTYFFAVSAYNTVGEGLKSTAQSVVVKATPAAPVISNVTPGSSKVTLSWSAVPSATKYTVKYGQSVGNLTSSLDTTSIAPDIALTNGIRYYFVVAAMNASGYGPDSGMVSAIPVLSKPAAPQVTATAGNGSVTLNWNSVPDATKYTVNYGPNSGGPYIYTEDAGTATSKIISSLTNGTPYYFEVVASNTAGSTASSQVSATPQVPPPAIALDASYNKTATNVTTVPSPHTVGNGTNRALVVTLNMGDLSTTPQATAVTYGGQAMTLIDRQSYTPAGTKSTVEMWYLLNPPTGTADVQATFNTTVDKLAIGSVSLTGVKQQAPEAKNKATGAGTVVSVNLTTATAGAWVLDSIFYDWTASSIAVDGTQTQLYEKDMSSADVYGSSYKANVPAGAVTMRWNATSSDDWAMVAAAFAPAGGSARLESTPVPAMALAAEPSNDILMVVQSPSPEKPSGPTLAMKLKAALSRLGQLVETILGVGEAEAATLDMTSFLETDPNNQITPSSSCISFTNVEGRKTSAMVYKTNSTTGDFQYDFEAKLTQVSDTIYDAVLWGITNANNSTYPNWSNGAYLGVKKSGTGFVLNLKKAGGSGTLGSQVLLLNTRYYFRVKRVGSNVTAYAYSDPSRSLPVSSVVRAVDANPYTYLYAFSTRGGLTFTNYQVSGEVCLMTDSGTLNLPAPTLSEPVGVDASITLNWTAVNGAVGYKVKYGNSPGGPYNTIVDAGYNLSKTISGLPRGSARYYVVSAYDASGIDGANSNEKSATLLNSPSLLNPTPKDKSVELSWNISSGSTAYTVKYGINLGGPYNNTLPAGSATSITVPNLTNGTPYYFVVLAANSNCTSVDSNEETATPYPPPNPPVAPTLNSATPGDRSVVLNWTAVTSATSYTVRYGTTKNGPYNSSKNDGTTNTTQTIPNLTNGTPYYFVVHAKNGSVEGDPSNEMEAIPQVPSEVPVLNSAVPGMGSVTLGWSQAVGANSYTVKYGTTEGGPYNETWDAGNNTSTTVTGLANGTKFYFVVFAVKTSGPSADSNPMSATTLLPSPTLNSATPGNTSVALQWSAVSGATFYTVKYGTTQGGSYNYSADAGNNTSKTVNSLTNGTPYYFVVIASNAIIASDPSGELSATPVVPATAPADRPVVSAASGNGKVTLNWSAVSGATFYKMAYKPEGGSYSAYTDIGNVTEYPVTGLTNGTKYYFLVKAANAIGAGPESVEVSATPQAGGVSEVITDIKYNAAGQQEKVYFGNGNRTEYQYDANLRVWKIKTFKSDNTLIQDLEYLYDGVGNIYQVKDLMNTSAQLFGYDALGRLTFAQGKYVSGQPAVTKEYRYSLTGNLLSKDSLSNIYSYGDGVSAGIHAVTAAGSDLTFQYDRNGNLTKQTEGGVVTDFIYDAENRLERVSRGGTAVGRYTYDDAGQRTTKTVGGQLTVFVGDIHERRGSFATDHIYAGGERVATLKYGAVEYYHSDHLGGTNLITDSAGAVRDTVEYEPFGGFSRHDGASAGQEGRFYTDQYRDQESGLYYYNARYYNPRIARFMTADWIIPDPTNPQAFNRYSYVANNPVNFIDPTGNVTVLTDSQMSDYSIQGFYSASAFQSTISIVDQTDLGDDQVITNYAVASYSRSVSVVGGQVNPQVEYLNSIVGRMAAPDGCGVNCPTLHLDRDISTFDMYSIALGASEAVVTARALYGVGVAGVRFFEGSFGRTLASEVGEAGLKGMAGRYLFESVDKGTFSSKAASLIYHLNKHGKGRTAIEYVKDAMSFYNKNKGAGTDVILKNGMPGIKIKVGDQGGYWTKSGKLITYWD